MDIETAKVFAAAGAVAIGGIAPALAEGMVAAKAMESIGRNPSVANDIFPKMIVGMAICESTAIYALLISFIILFT
jgi:F-type H+-transporting ATPase subunit c